MIIQFSINFVISLSLSKVFISIMLNACVFLSLYFIHNKQIREQFFISLQYVEN